MSELSVVTVDEYPGLHEYLADTAEMVERKPLKHSEYSCRLLAKVSEHDADDYGNPGIAGLWLSDLVVADHNNGIYDRDGIVFRRAIKRHRTEVYYEHEVPGQDPAGGKERGAAG